MAKDKKMVEAITSMDEDFAQWYTDVVKKAELADYSSVKGFVVLKPYGFGIWENIQKTLDSAFKSTGVENVCMPLLIPESLINKEKDHVEGFAPEAAWVTHGGSEELQERLCVRPTSETLFCDFYSKDIRSYRDLPKVYNQWCSVVRWEKETRPFLRTREFLWQEGHTAHATEEEAQARTIQMLNVYVDFFENELAIPVIKGQKTEKEKFAGAVSTLCLLAIYGGLIYLGAVTDYPLSKQVSRTDLLLHISHSILGHWGSISIAIAIALACLTTAIALTSAVGAFFEELTQNFISYKTGVIASSLISAVLSINSVDSIIDYAIHILLFIYPIVFTLILYVLLFEKFVSSRLPYIMSILTTALLSLISSLRNMGTEMHHLYDWKEHLPLSDYNLEWLLPSFVVFVTVAVFSKILGKFRF